MQKNLILFFIVIGISIGSFIGCKSTPQKMVAPETFIKVPFKKLINPAFSSEYYDKGVEFKAKFHSQMNIVSDLPEEYQTGYVRMILRDEDMGDSFSHVLIPKDQSDIVFSAKLADLWLIKAKALELPRTTEKSILLIITSVEKVNQKK